MGGAFTPFRTVFTYHEGKRIHTCFIKMQLRKTFGVIYGSRHWIRETWHRSAESLQCRKELKQTKTNRQLRQVIGFFSFWRGYISNFSHVAKPFTDLNAKSVSERIPFHQRHLESLNQLKRLLCKAVENPLDIIDISKPFTLFVNASQSAVATYSPTLTTFRQLDYLLNPKIESEAPKL
jgi:hypothetical protein